MVTITRAQPEDYAEAAHIVSEAMIDNPFCAAIYKGDKKKFEKGMYYSFKQLPRELYVARDETQKILGVMQYTEPPYCFPMLREGVGGSITRLILRITMGKMAKKFFEGFREWQKRDPEEDHVHPTILSVLPEFQGKGTGTLLMKHFCDKADEINKIAYLETDRPRNVTLYKHLGFKVIDEAPVLGVKHWFMLRPKKH
jgi:ribosomal protein S18 acetylase RimI-like enzyme